MFSSSRGGVRLIKDVRDGRGVKGKADKCGKGGEGVQNPGNFADVLYVWSLREMKLPEYYVLEDTDVHKRSLPIRKWYSRFKAQLPR